MLITSGSIEVNPGPPYPKLETLHCIIRISLEFPVCKFVVRKITNEIGLNLAPDTVMVAGLIERMSFCPYCEYERGHDESENHLTFYG